MSLQFTKSASLPPEQVAKLASESF